MLIRCFAALAVMLSMSCVYRRDLVAGGALQVECREAAGVTIGPIEAFQAGESLLVKGYVKAREPLGCVDVVVEGPEGDVLSRTRTPVVRHRHHRAGHPPVFEAWLRVEPPESSRLLITHATYADDPRCAAGEGPGPEAG
ncbi:hypothetical protein [Tautonia sociabilis]|uniref:Lipoprotein n=1 Tax=Tautonia sociabilis TaxID=2080755 RepID=A0A432MIH1_9BACT|nr:hypothetical protein [Tautonia sociabilis]RUL87027.1 hypothetical protein TsocGM_14635 [Tautonia sociabilis]